MRGVGWRKYGVLGLGVSRGLGGVFSALSGKCSLQLLIHLFIYLFGFFVFEVELLFN